MREDFTDAFKELGITNATTTINFGYGLSGRSTYTTTLTGYMHLENVILDLYFMNKELKERLKAFESTRLVLTEKKKKK